MLSKTFITFAFLLSLAVFVSGCTGSPGTSTPASTTPTGDDSSASTGLSLWLTTEFTDVNSGETFTIAELEKPVLVESFAVWCPVCTRQQQETKKLEAQRDDIISVSLDTDPNEDASNIRSHTQKNGFDWKYAIASGAVSASLSQDFGADILSVPLAPMIVVCDNNKATQIRNGVKAASELGSTVDDLCG